MNMNKNIAVLRTGYQMSLKHTHAQFYHLNKEFDTDKDYFFNAQNRDLCTVDRLFIH